MDTLVHEYLKNNGFNQDSATGWVSDVIIGHNPVVEGFKDERQLAIIRAQFGGEFEKIKTMRIIAKEVNGIEWDVELKWTIEDGTDLVTSSSWIGGDDLYHLVSQAIVLAEV